MSEEQETKSVQDGITGLHASGFKSIVRSQAIEIRPLTILAGANSSGKSSIIQPLLLLKQTLEARFDPGPLLLEGPNVAFTSATQFFSCIGNRQCSETFETFIRIGLHTWLWLIFRRNADRAIQVHEMNFGDGRTTGKLRPDMTSAELEATFPSAAKMGVKFLLDPIKGLALTTREIELKGSPDLVYEVRRNRFFLEAFLRAGTIEFTLPSPAATVGTQISKLIHVPGLRGNPERTYPVTAVGSTFPGTFENYTASVITKWQAEDKDKLEALNRALDSLGLTYRIVARPVAETRVELMVGRLAHGKREGDNDLVSVADVGFGVSQTLPVLVALLVAEPGQAVYLEEPEIHLHPRAQSQMAGILAEAAIRGVRVIAETHSSILLRSIQTLVATGKLPPDLVKLHWFSRSAEDGSTEIHSADLDKQGAFGDWPEDFDEVALETEKQYLDAAEMGHRS